MKARVIGCAIILLVCSRVWGGTISLDLSFTIGSQGMRSLAAANYKNALGWETSEPFSYAHAILKNEEGLEGEGGQSSTPWSNVLYTSTVGTVPNCYSAQAQVIADDSRAEKRTTSTCYQGPPPPPQDPIDKCEAPSGQGPECSPIIINMTNGAWKFSGTDSPVLFDINADGRANWITWTGQGEPLAFLALDRNSNGIIDDGGELFGNFTRLASGQRAPNGFEALAEFDGNGDGSVSVSDPIWNALLLWTDANHDGVSQPEEISRIAESHVIALGTDYHESARTDPADNAFRYKGILHLRDHGRRPYYDVYFRSVP